MITTLDVSGLSSSYFRLVKKILIKAMGQSDATRFHVGPGERLTSEEKKCGGDLVSGSANLMNVFVQCSMKMHATYSQATLSPAMNRGESGVAVAFNAFLSHLRICEDEATALELIDILSILSSKSSELAHRALEACWRVLHTVYSVSCGDANETNYDEVPRAFLNAVSLVITSQKSMLDSQNTGQLTERVLSATIVKTTTSGTKDAQENAVLQHGVLLMWGLTASWVDHCSFDYLSKLTSELVSFLDGIDGSAPSNLTTGDNFSCELEADNSQRRERLQKRRNRPYVSTIPSLTVSSFALLFELLLHSAIATFVASPHARKAVTERDGEAGVNESPFQHHHDRVQLISRILDAYVSRFHLFPRRMVSVVLGACKHLLSVCVFQVRGCVQWRNAQPILSVEERRAGVHDYGSIKFLERLLQSFATFGVKKVMSVCQSIRQLCCPSAESGEDEEEERLVSLPQNDKRFTSLILSAQKTMDALRDVSSAHNLVLPLLDNASFEKPPKEQATKRNPVKDVADKGYHELDWDGKIHTEKDEMVGDPKKKRRRVAPTLVSVDVDHTINDSSHKSSKSRLPAVEDDEYEWGDNGESSCALDDNVSKTSSDAFGVSGRWGDEDGSKEEQSSPGSLELEVSDIFQAV